VNHYPILEERRCTPPMATDSGNVGEAMDEIVLPESCLPFRGHRKSQLLDRVIKLINPIHRGWVAYFAVENSNECFGFIKHWVEKKIRRHMARAPEP
jgi:Group II intron, maturase-specific domain